MPSMQPDMNAHSERSTPIQRENSGTETDEGRQHGSKDAEERGKKLAEKWIRSLKGFAEGWSWSVKQRDSKLCCLVHVSLQIAWRE